MTRRNEVAWVTPKVTTHAGLWLDKYLIDDEAEAKQTFVAEVAELSREGQTPTLYNQFFQRWKASLALAGVTEQQMHVASVKGRLSIGLGGEAVLETAVTLHRTYGMPYIPGSALKGLAANYARNRLSKEDWGEQSDAYKIMFGEPTSAGYLIFYDALYVPGRGCKSGDQPQALWPDVITVHHPDYYQGNEPPADWDSPTPVPFLSATGDYLLAIGGPADWVAKAFEILAYALVEEGVGAKTSSGYGRMSIAGMADTPSTADGSASGNVATDPEQAIVDQYKLELEQMSVASVASQIPTVAQRWQALEISPANKRYIAQSILDRVQEAGRTKKSQGKPWFEQLRSYVQSEDQP